MIKSLKIIKTCLLLTIFSFCSSSSTPSLPSNFNNCEVSLDESLKTIQEIKTNNNINFDIRIVREVTDRDECIDMVLGTNLDQGSEIQEGSLVDLVVGIKKMK